MEAAEHSGARHRRHHSRQDKDDEDRGQQCYKSSGYCQDPVGEEHLECVLKLGNCVELGRTNGHRNPLYTSSKTTSTASLAQAMNWPSIALRKGLLLRQCGKAPGIRRHAQNKTASLLARGCTVD